MCLSNNLCLNQGGAELISRGSCTDETWQSSECGQYCLDGNYVLAVLSIAWRADNWKCSRSGKRSNHIHLWRLEWSIPVLLQPVRPI